MRARLVAVALLLACSCGPTDLETIAKGDVFGRASASGIHASVTVDGTYRGGWLAVDVEAVPRQTVHARAQTRCSDGGQQRSEDAEETGGTPMAFPVHPDGCVACVCTVTATGSLAESGRIQVTLIGSGSGTG